MSKKKDRPTAAEESVKDLSEVLPTERKRDRAAAKKRKMGRGARTEQPAKPGMPGSVNDSRRCSATAHRTGQRCKAPAIKGTSVCRVHGGAAPQVQKSAKERLLELADPAIAALSKIVRDEDTDDSVRLRAALGICDRIGLGPGQTVTVQATKWDALLDDLRADAVQVDRSLGTGNPDALPSGGGDEHSWEDFDQIGYDLTRENFREQEAEDAEPYTTRLDPYDGRTIKGEVVEPVHSRYEVPPDLAPDDPPRYVDHEAREADRKPT